MKKLLTVLMTVMLVLVSATGCGPKEPQAEQSEVQKIIAEAQTMTLEELAKKLLKNQMELRFMVLVTQAVVKQLYHCLLLTCRQLILRTL